MSLTDIFRWCGKIIHSLAEVKSVAWLFSQVMSTFRAPYLFSLALQLLKDVFQVEVKKKKKQKEINYGPVSQTCFKYHLRNNDKCCRDIVEEVKKRPPLHSYSDSHPLISSPVYRTVHRLLTNSLLTSFCYLTCPPVPPLMSCVVKRRIECPPTKNTLPHACIHMYFL